MFWERGATDSIKLNRFGKLIKDNSTGQCQKYPPTMVDGIPKYEIPKKVRLDSSSLWPQTKPDDSCDKWLHTWSAAEWK